MKRPRVNEIFFHPSLAIGYTIFRTRSDCAQCLCPVDNVGVLLPTSVVATSAIRDAYFSASSMKCFKCINVKTSLPGTPSFANAKLLKLLLTGVRMLEKHLAASLGDLRGEWTGEKVDDRDQLVGDAISLKMLWAQVRNVVYPLAKLG